MTTAPTPSSSDDAPAVLVETRPGVVRLTLNRPAKGNALGLTMAREVLAAIAAAETDESVHVLTLTGAAVVTAPAIRSSSASRPRSLPRTCRSSQARRPLTTGPLSARTSVGGGISGRGHQWAGRGAGNQRVHPPRRGDGTSVTTGSAGWPPRSGH